MQQPRGYTLIELLLVLAVLTALATTAIKWYRQHWWEHHVTSTATEIENLLSAALNYQTEHEQWPDSHRDLTTCWQTKPSNDDFTQFYSPLHQQPNRLGQYYCYGTLGETGSLFWVGLHLNSQQANALGPRLMARLPNAYLTSEPGDPEHPPCDNNACFLISEVPGQHASRPSGTQVIGVGLCQPAANDASATDQRCSWVGTEGVEPKTAVYQVKFSCPALTEKKLMASVNFLDVGKARGEPYVLRTLTLASDCSIQDGCLLKIAAARSDGHSVTTGAQGHIGASYLAYCQPQITSS